MKKDLYKYLLLLGDQSMVLGHRLSELCGHGPALETDMALTNISLDLFGEVRNYFQYAASIGSEGETEDTIAFLRSEREYHNPTLVEQPNTDFAHVIVRQYLFDVYHRALLEQLRESTDLQLAAIAEKSLKEAKYHYRFSTNWMKRLALGTEESRERLINAIEHLYPFAHELYHPTVVEVKMHEQGIGADLAFISEKFKTETVELFKDLGVEVSNLSDRVCRGKTGCHSEFLGHILSDLQYMQRAYPRMQW